MNREEHRPKMGRLWAAAGKYKYVLLVLLVGVALMLWPGSVSRQSAESGEEAVQGTSPEELDHLEEELARILSKIQGVGKVEVMLTLHSGSELVLAQDNSLRYSGNTQAPDDYDRSSQTVTITNSGREEVVVTQQRFPQYRGALIVCEGGGNDAVRLQIVKAVSVLTGLGSDCISVVKWAVSNSAAAEIQP